jgi:hypothetical protein
MEMSPLEFDWQYGPLPKVETVPYDCLIILWSKDYIGTVTPHGDSLNPLRWCDSGGLPHWGITSPEGWWTWYRKGEKERPPEVQTWAEKYEKPEILAWEAHLKECEQCQKTDKEAMKQAFSSRIRMSEMKDYTPEYCLVGQKLLAGMFTPTTTDSENTKSQPQPDPHPDSPSAPIQVP